MRTRSRTAMTAAVTLLLGGAAGCAGNPPPVSLQADTESLERLRGEWRGQYWSEETGRRAGGEWYVLRRR